MTLLEKKVEHVQMNAEEIKAARKVMRQLNLILDKPSDVTEAINNLKESARIYSKKLEMNEKRKIIEEKINILSYTKENNTAF